MQQTYNNKMSKMRKGAKKLTQKNQNIQHQLDQALQNAQINNIEAYRRNIPSNSVYGKYVNLDEHGNPTRMMYGKYNEERPEWIERELEKRLKERRVNHVMQKLKEKRESSKFFSNILNKFKFFKK